MTFSMGIAHSNSFMARGKIILWSVHFIDVLQWRVHQVHIVASLSIQVAKPALCLIVPWCFGPQLSIKNKSTLRWRIHKRISSTHMFDWRSFSFNVAVQRISIGVRWSGLNTLIWPHCIIVINERPHRLFDLRYLVVDNVHIRRTLPCSWLTGARLVFFTWLNCRFLRTCAILWYFWTCNPTSTSKVQFTCSHQMLITEIVKNLDSAIGLKIQRST
jgi:hypothetical protein